MNIDNLESAVKTLESGFKQYTSNAKSPVTDMLADSCVKRFKYTLETSIKTMRKFLKEIYFIDEKDLTINNIFRLMEGYELIQSWERWRAYYQKRNDTAHEYNIKKSRDLIAIIPQYIEDVLFLLKNLKTILKKPI